MTTENEKPDEGTTDETITDEQATEENKETMLDVIGAAIDEATPDDVLAANKEDKDDDEGNTDSAAANAEAETKTGEAGDTDAGSDDGKTGDDATGDDATGEKPAGDGTESDAGKTGDDAGKTGDEAEPDPIADPIPEGTNEKTATRIKSLIDIAKHTTGRADERDQLLTSITETGATPDQYANTLGFLKLYNSDSQAERQQALEVAEGLVRELRVELGQGTADLLESHDDLKAEVEAGTLTEPRAIEIATGREKATLATSRTEAANVQQATDEETTTLIATGKAQLNTLEGTLKTFDTDYARLRPIFIAALSPALKQTLATDWGAKAQEIYKQVKEANPAPAVLETPENDGKPLPKTPLRAKGSGGGSATQDGGADTALAALDAALEEM